MPLDLSLPEAGTQKRPFWTHFRARHEFNIDGLSAQSLLSMVADYAGLVRRHGWQRVLEFYEYDLLPRLKSLPLSVETWRARYEVGCRTLAMQMFQAPVQKVSELAQELVTDLPQARFEDDQGANRLTRHQVRTFLAAQIAGTAHHLHAQGHVAEAMHAYQMLNRLGELTPEQRTHYAHLLWRANDRSVAAVTVYLSHMNDQDWAVDEKSPSGAIQRFVEAELAIDDETPQAHVRQRLLFNQMVLCRATPWVSALQYAGMGYLRLNEPERALTYLLRAQQEPGEHAAATSFYLGRALFETDAFEEAAAAFTQAEIEGFSVTRMIAWKGRAYAKAGQWAKARETFQRAQDELGTVSDSDFYLDWGRVSFLDGEVQSARHQFRSALDLKPSNWRAQHGLAICLETLGQREEAMVELRQAVSQECDFAPIFHLLGVWSYEVEAVEEARTWHQRALDIDPENDEYALFLGLALSDLGVPDGLAYLERAAAAGQGGPEVLRRLVLAYFEAGDRETARHWLKQLEGVDAMPEAVARFRARDLVSQATELLNAGRFQAAIELWQQAAEVFPESDVVQERLATALLHGAMEQLRGGRVDGAWEQIDHVHALNPNPDSAFLLGVSRLVRGEFADAQMAFSDLFTQHPERKHYAFFAALAAYCAEDESAVSQLENLELPTGMTDLHGLLAILNVQLAALEGDFAKASEQVKSWVAQPEAVRDLQLPQHQINALAALCVLRGTRQRQHRALALFKELNTQYGDDYWRFAITLVEHYIATRRGLERAAEAESPALEACNEGYQSLLREIQASEREAIQRHYAELLRFIICHYTGRGELRAGQDALQHLSALHGTLPPELEALNDLLSQRLAVPSHEQAYALLERGPDTASDIWRSLLKRDPDDLTSLQHLACLAWSRAYDAVQEERYEASAPLWREGLEWYQQLFGKPAYWDALREKGRALQTPGNPFDEAAFDVWRHSALQQMAETVLRLIFHVLAGFEPGRHGKEIERRTRAARALMEVLRGPFLPPSAQVKFADDLADHYLDPDPTRLPNPKASVQRAALVIDIDPNNAKARLFILRAVTHDVRTQRNEGSRDYQALFSRIDDIQRHADWLEERLPALASDQQRYQIATLVAYYEERAELKHEEGQAKTNQHNKAPGDANARTYLEQIRQCYRVSDQAYRQALNLDQINPKAQRMLEKHEEQYQVIDKLLR